MNIYTNTQIVINEHGDPVITFNCKNIIHEAPVIDRPEYHKIEKVSK